MSAIIRTPPAPIGAPFSIAVSLAVADTAARFVTESVFFKWPNDVEIANRKVAGVLAESRVSTDGSGVVIVGIGLNVNLEVTRYATIAQSAASLRTFAGGRLSVEDVDEVLVRALDQRIAELEYNRESLITTWGTRLSTLGKLVTVRTRQGAIAGLAEDFDETGRLLVRDARGHVHSVAEGDVTLRG